MNVEILEYSLEDEGFLPLTANRSLAECMVANTGFREAQEAELQAARFHQTADRTRLTLYVHGNAWLSQRDLKTIKRLDCPTVIQNEHGDVLAWTAAGTIVGDSADKLIIRDSLLLQHSWDLLELNAILINRRRENELAGEVADGVTIDGSLSVGSGTRILPGAYVEGNVVIGRNCKIGPNCYLRGPTAIGDSCHVGNAVEIKASILMDGSSIGHLSYVGDSIIGKRANFGAGTITANLRHDGANQRSEVGGKLVDTGRRKLGAIIGDCVHTGINTSIYPGRKLWPGISTLPGEVVDHDLKGS